MINPPETPTLEVDTGRNDRAERIIRLCGGDISSGAIRAISNEIREAITEANTPDGYGDLPTPMVLAEGFGDPETLFNSREWLQDALETKGAKIEGGGVGCGQADLSIVLDGCKFNVSIRPIEK